MNADEARLLPAPRRLPALLAARRHMGHDEWLRAFGDVWPLCSQVNVHVDEVREILRALSPADFRVMMDGNGWQAFTRDEVLPDPIVMYRGCWLRNIHGVSYTLRRRLASAFTEGRFAPPDGEEPLLVTAHVPRERCALLLSRGEGEIVTGDATVERVERIHAHAH